MSGDLNLPAGEQHEEPWAKPAVSVLDETDTYVRVVVVLDAAKMTRRTAKRQEDEGRCTAKSRARRGWPDTSDSSCRMISAEGMDRRIASIAALACEDSGRMSRNRKLLLFDHPEELRVAGEAKGETAAADAQSRARHPYLLPRVKLMRGSSSWKLGMQLTQFLEVLKRQSELAQDLKKERRSNLVPAMKGNGHGAAIGMIPALMAARLASL